ncbi:MAG: hypothetical protein GZ091_14625 [Paludibacter sp.]|nr:hypothetical protein [Paludibacter sp.]
METKYGVNTFIKEVHIKAVDFDETFRLPEYRYIIEIVEISSQNGNGVKEMKIYTEGKLVELTNKNWKVSPIVRLPYNWSGYRPELEIIDDGLDVHTHNCRMGESVYHTRDYIEIIKWVFNSIIELDKVQNVSQLKLYDKIHETNRLLNIYSKNGVELYKLYELVELVGNDINQLKEMKDILTEENYRNTRLKTNTNIELFNAIKLNKIADN